MMNLSNNKHLQRLERSLSKEYPWLSPHVIPSVALLGPILLAALYLQVSSLVLSQFDEMLHPSNLLLCLVYGLVFVPAMCLASGSLFLPLVRLTNAPDDEDTIRRTFVRLPACGLLIGFGLFLNDAHTTIIQAMSPTFPAQMGDWLETFLFGSIMVVWTLCTWPADPLLSGRRQAR